MCPDLRTASVSALESLCHMQNGIIIYVRLLQDGEISDNDNMNCKSLTNARGLGKRDPSWQWARGGLRQVISQSQQRLIETNSHSHSHSHLKDRWEALGEQTPHRKALDKVLNPQPFSCDSTTANSNRFGRNCNADWIMFSIQARKCHQSLNVANVRQVVRAR